MRRLWVSEVEAMTAYRALRELRYPTDLEVVARLVAGENPPLRQRGMKTVKEGAIVEDLPAESIPMLLEKGWIEEMGIALAELEEAEEVAMPTPPTLRFERRVNFHQVNPDG